MGQSSPHMPVANTHRMNLLQEFFVSFIKRVSLGFSLSSWKQTKHLSAGFQNIFEVHFHYFHQTFRAVFHRQSNLRGSTSLLSKDPYKYRMPAYPTILSIRPTSSSSAGLRLPLDLAKHNHTKTAKMPMQWNDQADARVRCFPSRILVLSTVLIVIPTALRQCP
jgi:hypothetical protein